MFRTLLFGVGFALALATALPARAADTPAIAGVWWTPEHDGKIEIKVEASGAASGRLIAVSPEDADSLDDHNPDPSLRARPVLGLVIMRNFWPGKNGAWSGGRIYDPDSGTTYSGTLTLGDDGRLAMRGDVLFGLIGRTEILERVTGSHPATQQPGEPDLVYLER